MLGSHRPAELQLLALEGEVLHFGVSRFFKQFDIGVTFLKTPEYIEDSVAL